jgi:hypothetical protein
MLRYKEHVQAIRNNNSNSRHSNHIVNMRHHIHKKKTENKESIVAHKPHPTHIKQNQPLRTFINTHSSTKPNFSAPDNGHVD